MHMNRVLLSASMLLLVACSGAEEAAQPSDAGAVSAAAIEVESPWPRGPWTELADALLQAGDLQSATATTRTILAKGGIATVGDDGVLTPAQGPAAGFAASPGETLRLAREARRRAGAGRLTTAELAQLLENFGFPFPDADPDAPAERPRPVLLPEDEDAFAAAQRAEDERARNAAADARRQARDALAQARKDAQAREQALIEALNAATDAWQKARQAAARAAPAARADADARVAAAWEARAALIAQRGQLQQQARADADALRERALADAAAAQRLARTQRLIGPDHAAGERLMVFLGDWVRQAAQAPDDPHSFTPLFLAEMALRQDPPVDLTGSHYTRPGRGPGPPVDLRGAPRAQQLRWTLLELELFGAAFERGQGNAPGRSPSAAGAAMRRLGELLLPSAHAANACIDFQEAYGQLGGEVMGTIAGAGVGAGLERAVQGMAGAGTAADFGKAMAAAGIVARLSKLAAFYSEQDIHVEPQPPAMHKRTGVEAPASFVARVGIHEDEWKDYQRIAGEMGARIDRLARDCAAALGLPTFADAVDVAQEAEGWLVEWRLWDGAGMHARTANNTWTYAGRMAMALKRESQTSVTATLRVEVLPEERHSGKVVRAYATAQASLDGATMPSLGTIASGAAGGIGLGSALVDLFSGWFQVMNMPKAYGTIEIEYHCPRPTTLHRVDKPIGDGGGDDDPSSCLVAAEG